MKNHIVLILCCLLLCKTALHGLCKPTASAPLKPASPRHNIELAICAIFQDDAAFLPEWIEFHQMQGVEKFYLYNNLSTDDYKRILKPYTDSKLVELIEWQHKQKNIGEWNGIQCAAYKDCIKRCCKSVVWCAFIDTDEFLFCPAGFDLRDVLGDYKDFCGVGVNWVCYGTSGVYDHGERLLRDVLVMRAPIDYGVNHHIKSIVQTKSVVGCENPHYFLYKQGGYAVTENKERVDGPFTAFVSPYKLRINHYWTRDGKFFSTVKRARAEKWGGSWDMVREQEYALNVVYDPILSSTEIE